MPAQQAAVATWDVPRRFVVHNRYEHIQAAAIRAVARKGYHATSVRDICEEAYISRSVFREYFSGKEEAVLSAVEAGVDQFMADCQTAFYEAHTWPDGVWDGMSAFIEWSANEPHFTHVSIVELMSVGPSGLELLGSLMDALAIFIAPGYELPDMPAQGGLDAQITGEVFHLLHSHLTQRPEETLEPILPELVRATLRPFLGERTTDDFIAYRTSNGHSRNGSRLNGRP